MKKLSIATAGLILLALGAGAVKASKQPDRRIPRTVQGIDYRSTLPESARKIMAASDYPDNPGDLTVPDGEFTFDMIESWAGEGANRAALVVQWNVDGEQNALVFGYRWDGVATGSDMFRAVVSANPQLYGLIQYTNVSSPTDPLGGYTINGIGWDADGDGDIALIDTGKGDQVYEAADGLFYHPRGYDPDKGGKPDYDYDNWKARDTDDFWQAGWYSNGFWSYWVKSAESETFSFSSWGASGRVLEDGCWDGWNFSLGFGSYAWHNFKAAPSPMPADAKTLFKVDGVYYKLVSYLNKTVEVTAPVEMEGETLGAYSGEMEIPASFVDGETTYTVVAIGDDAMKDSGVTGVTLPDGVAKIGKSAFAGSQLSRLSRRGSDSLVISTGTDRFDNITSLGEGAFAGCSAFADIFYPVKIENLPANLYSGTAVKEIVIPENVREVGISAFSGCAQLESLVVPANVRKLGESAFADCDLLTSVKAENTAPAEAFDNTFSATACANATLTVPQGYEPVYREAAGWSGFTKYASFTLPVNVNDRFVMNGVSYKVTALSEESKEVIVTYMPFEGKFSRDNVKKANAAYKGEVVVPEVVGYQGIDLRVVALGDSAFYSASNITSLSLPKSISRIPDLACSDCSAMTTVTCGGVITEFGNSAFSGCKLLKSVPMAEGLLKIGRRAFDNNKALTSVSFPSTLQSIDENAFYGAGLTEVTVPENVTLANRVFNSCTSMTKAKLPASMKSIPESTFNSCTSLESVELPEGLEQIGSAAFKYCKKLKIEIPATVTKIGDSAFSGCTALKSMTLPAAITKLPMSIFQGCSALESVTMSDKVTEIGNNAFSNCTNLREFKFPEEGVENAVTEPAALAENAAEGDAAQPEGIIVTPSSLQTIGNYAFQSCTSMKQIKLNEGLKKIGKSAFAKNSQLTDIELPSTVTTLGDRCFEGCGLSKIVIPASVTSLGSYMGKSCNNDNVTFYICAATPATCGSNTFATKDYKTFAPLVVPTGCKAAYEASKNWKKSAISQPEITGIAAGEPAMSRANKKDVLTVPFSYLYDMENLPAQFAAACDAVAAAAEGTTFTLSYKLPDAETETTATALYSDGKLTVSGLSLQGNQTYTGHIVAKSGETEYSSAEFEFASAAAYVSEISIDGVSGDEIILNPKHIKLITCTVLPEDAENKKYTVTLEGAGETNADRIASTYNVRLWDENNKNASYPELIAHRAGECKLVIKANDGGGYVREYKVTVTDPDRTQLAADTYLDGTLFLNEEWYGHANGGANYLTKEGKMIYQAYERENPGMSFGCTSQYGAIWNDRLIVISKQAADGGDPLPGGGRVVVADAKSLKRLGSIDELKVEGEDRSGDGRSVVGATADEVYVGTHQGIYVVDINNFTVVGKIGSAASEESDPDNLYASQIGDMVHAGKYVFGIRQSKGVFVIDPETREMVKSVEDANVQGITQSADGMVWVATLTADEKASRFVCYDPATLEELADKSVTMPESIGKVSCSWGAWRTTQFFGCRSRNVLWFSSGSSISNGGNGDFYCWEIGSDPAEIKPFFSLNNPKLAAHTPGISQATYGTSRYDDRSGEFIVMTTEFKASGHYRYNWIHFVNPATGSITRSIELEPYYWFQAMPIFPDKHAPSLGEDFATVNLIRNVDMSGNVTSAEPVELNLSELVEDADNIGYNLDFVLPDNYVSSADEAESESMRATASAFVDAKLDGATLTLTPLETGKGNVVLNVGSNGRHSELLLPVEVVTESGVDGLDADGRRVIVKGNHIYIYGFEGREFTVAGIDGTLYTRFTADSPEFVARFDIKGGVYVLSGNGVSVKFIVK